MFHHLVISKMEINEDDQFKPNKQLKVNKVNTTTTNIINNNFFS